MTEINLDLELWPRQMRAFTTSATELLFGGATEGGKSHFVRVALISWCLQIPGLQCVLIRKKFDDIKKNHVEGRTGFRALLSPLIAHDRVRITEDGIRFRHKVDGAECDSIIAFQHCQDERQFDSAQGVEKHVLVIDEATQISERLIKFFRTWVRMPVEMKETLPAEIRHKFPCIIYTANPIGASVPFFRRHFVDALPNEIIKEVAGFKRQFLKSVYTDNPSVDKAAHDGRLQGLGDEALAKALDLGDWTSLTGDFFPEWDEDRHVVDDFTPPQHWFRYRSFDWGTAEPFAIYWVAVSDGEPFRDDDGNERWFPRGALVFYREWYGCDDGHVNPDDNHPERGCRMRNQDIAFGILERSEFGFEKIPTLADRKPFIDNGGHRIARDFQDSGVLLTPADDSRIPGWSAVRGRLKGYEFDSNQPRVPMIYFVESCKYARDYIPALTRHPSEGKKEDAAEHGEATHACDAIRYACMAHSIVKDKKEPIESRIQKELARNKPTIKRITQDGGARWF